MFSCMHAGTADVVNVALVIGFDAGVLYFWGFKALMYLLVGVVLGGGLHPMAGHLIAEHYMFLKVSVTPCAGMYPMCHCAHWQLEELHLYEWLPRQHFREAPFHLDAAIVADTRLVLAGPGDI